ncbi:TPR repeat-containing thioredoxin TTL1-like [Iris pallida]|uniref:TPR repeat-containing thioredoxin TTL1-like n=1 Tax=Iris pallida TaxID=29817 RepID=A0AAX6GLY5_IRIPA|nr:TPR repeat-containing thioredoxin TTL1-like [Iris pallida]
MSSSSSLSHILQTLQLTHPHPQPFSKDPTRNPLRNVALHRRVGPVPLPYTRREQQTLLQRPNGSRIPSLPAPHPPLRQLQLLLFFRLPRQAPPASRQNIDGAGPQVPLRRAFRRLHPQARPPEVWIRPANIHRRLRQHRHLPERRERPPRRQSARRAGSASPASPPAPPRAPTCWLRHEQLRPRQRNAGRTGPAGNAGSPSPLSAAGRRTGAGDPQEVTKLGNEHYKKGRLEEALRCYDRAVEICPGNAACRNNRAAALAGLGRRDAVGSPGRRCVSTPATPARTTGWLHCTFG